MKKISRIFRRVVLAAAFVLALVPTGMAFAREQQTAPEACDGVFRSYSCNLLDKTLDFMSGFYETVVERNLIIQPELFSSNYKGSTAYVLRSVWRKFRDIANLIIFLGLLLVIFSQITGIGISNYGIKKGLPKLVMAALLVNMSYIICQGCIDIANILGGRIGDFFEGLLAQTAPAGLDIGVANTWLGTIITGVVVAAFISRKALLTKVLIGFLLLLMICLLAMLVLYIILAIRQAMCILLVVLSPIAFACNILPGTKKVFDFWYKTFKSLLLAYPLCSLMVYGGGFAGAIVYSSWTTGGNSGNLIKAISFLLIATIPYFFIPSTIIKSMSVMRNVTQKISNFTMRNGRSIFGNSLLMQSLGIRDKRMREIARAGKMIDRKTGKLVSRFGYKGYKREDVTTGYLQKQRNAIRHGQNWLSGKLAGSDADPTLYGKLLRTSAMSHSNAAIAAHASMRRTNKYRSSRRYWRDYSDNSGTIGEVYDSKGRRKDVKLKDVKINGTKFNVGADGTRFTGYYKSDGTFVTTGYYDGNKWISQAGEIDTAGNFKKKSTLGTIAKQGIHEGISMRFANAMRAYREQKEKDEQYLKSVEQSATAVNKSALAQRLRTDLDLDTDKKQRTISKLIKEAFGPNDNRSDADLAAAHVSVMVSSLLEDGEAGRTALEAIIDDALASSGPVNQAEITEFVKNAISPADLDKIKKRNPILYNKIMQLKNGGNHPEAMKNNNLSGMSSKQFAEMDYAAQTRLVDQLYSIVSDNGANGANEQIVITAVSLAEGAIYDPDIRAALSPEHISMLENIAELRRRDLAEAASQTSARDVQLTKQEFENAHRGNTMVASPENIMTFSTEYVKSAVTTFAVTNGTTGADNYVQAYQKGDTVRMETILQAIDKELDSRLNAGGFTDLNQRNIERNAIMLNVIRSLNGGDPSNPNSGLYSTESQKIITKGSKETATPAEKEAADKLIRARAAVDMMEQRFARRSTHNG
jgi:hypothetical protein